MCELNGRVVVISVSQEGDMDRFIVTLCYGGLHHCEKMRKEVDEEVMLWPPRASGAGILGRPWPT